MKSEQNTCKWHLYLFKLKFLLWYFHVMGDMHFKSLDYPYSLVSVRERSFFMRERGLVGFGGGSPKKKIGLKGGAM